MTILFDATVPVKTARRFGSGILPTYPAYRAEFSAADLEWLAADNARREAADRVADLRWVESVTMDRIESGYC